MSSQAWREIELLLADGSSTTAGAEFAALLRAARAGEPSAATSDVLELALAVNSLGRPHDATAIIEAFKAESDFDVPAEARPWLENALGVFASDAGDEAVAAEAYARMSKLALEVHDVDAREEIESTARQNLGMLRVERDPASAIEMLHDAADRKLEIGDHASVLDIGLSIALAESQLGDSDSAIARLTWIIDAAVSLHDQRLLSSAYGNRGVVLSSVGRLADAEDDFRRSLRAARAMGLSDRVPRALLNMGSVLADSGRGGQALRYYRRGIRAALEVGAGIEEVRLRRALALSLAKKRRWRDAEMELREALARAQSFGDAVQLALVLTDIGALQLERGQVERSVETTERAVGYLEGSDNARQLETALLNLAQAYVAIGSRERAELTLRRVLESTAVDEVRSRVAELGFECWMREPPFPGRAADWLAIHVRELHRQGATALWPSVFGAVQLDDAGAPDAALRFFDGALAEVGDDLKTEWRIRNQRALALFATGAVSEAMAQLRWCQSTAEELGDRALQEIAAANVGELLRRSGEAQHAIEPLRRALELSEALLDRRATAANLGNLGLALLDVGEVEDAADRFEAQRELASAIGDRSLTAAGIAGSAHVAAAKGAHALAARKYEKAARLVMGLDDAKAVEYAGNALLSATFAESEAGERAGQYLIDTAQGVGREADAADFMARTASLLLARGDIDTSAEYYSLGLRLIELAAARRAAPGDARSDISSADVSREPSLAEVFGRLFTEYAVPVAVDVNAHFADASASASFLSEVARLATTDPEDLETRAFLSQMLRDAQSAASRELPCASMEMIHRRDDMRGKSDDADPATTRDRDLT